MERDGELLDAWRAGDSEAGERLFDLYIAPITRFFRNKVGAEVDDLVQSTFIACVEGRERIRDSGAFRSYIFAVAHNVLRAHYRKKSRLGPKTDFAQVSVADLSPGPSSWIHRNQEERLLLAALRAIPIEFQVALELFYWEGSKSKEIAEILDIPHATVRSRLRRARELLEQAISKLSDSPALRQSTSTDLERWAQGLRERSTLPAPA